MACGFLDEISWAGVVGRGELGLWVRRGMVEGGREGSRAGKPWAPGLGLSTWPSPWLRNRLGLAPGGSRENGGQAVGEDGKSLHSWAFGSNPPQRTRAKESGPAF